MPSLFSLYCPLPCAALHVGSQDASGFKALLCFSFCKVNISLGLFSAFLCSRGRRVRMVWGLLGAVLPAAVSAANVHNAPCLGSSSGCAGPLNQSCVWRLRSPRGQHHHRAPPKESGFFGKPIPHPGSGPDLFACFCSLLCPVFLFLPAAWTGGFKFYFFLFFPKLCIACMVGQESAPNVRSL